MHTETIDGDAYAARLQADNAAGRCFICELADERTAPGHEIVAYRDEHCVAFFPPWPRLYGYCLIAPSRHVTEVISDFTEDGYLDLQRRIHRLGRVLTGITPTERLYVFSFGSMQGVEHVHWHVAPLPPGVPFGEQQFAAVGKPEYLVIPRTELVELARRIGAGMTALAEAGDKGQRLLCGRTGAAAVRSMAWCRSAGQALISLPRCLRAAQAEPERHLLPGHSLTAGDQQQGLFELVDLCADLGHKRQRGGQVASVQGILTVLHPARREEHHQPDRLARGDHGQLPAAVAAGGVIRVPLVDAEERGVFTFGSRLGRVGRGPCIGHACESYVETPSCQCFIFNEVLLWPRTMWSRQLRSAQLLGMPAPSPDIWRSESM